MSPAGAEALRQYARQFLGKQILIGNDATNASPFVCVGIRMKVFHSNDDQPRPVEFFNIEEGPLKGIAIDVIIQGLINGEVLIDLDAILQPIEGSEEYIFLELNGFCTTLSRFDKNQTNP